MDRFRGANHLLCRRHRTAHSEARWRLEGQNNCLYFGCWSIFILIRLGRTEIISFYLEIKLVKTGASRFTFSDYLCRWILVRLTPEWLAGLVVFEDSLLPKSSAHMPRVIRWLLTILDKYGTYLCLCLSLLLFGHRSV